SWPGGGTAPGTPSGDEHASGHLAVGHVAEHGLDLLEGVCARHELVQLEATLSVQVDDDRDADVGSGRAVARAQDAPVDVGEGGDPERRLGGGRRDPDNDAVAAPRQDVDGLTEDGRVAHALERMVDTVGQK